MMKLSELISEREALEAKFRKATGQRLPPYSSNDDRYVLNEQNEKREPIKGTRAVQKVIYLAESVDTLHEQSRMMHVTRKPIGTFNRDGGEQYGFSGSNLSLEKS